MVSPPVSHFIVVVTFQSKKLSVFRNPPQTACPREREVVTIVLILKVFQPVSLTQAGGNKCAFRSGCVCMSMLRLQRFLDGIHGFQLGFAICRSAWQHGCSFCLDVVVETLRRFMPDSVCAVLLILLFEGALLNWVGSQRSCRSPVHRGGGGGACLRARS